MTENLDYLGARGGNGRCLVSGETEGGSVVANRVKNGDYEEYTANELYF